VNGDDRHDEMDEELRSKLAALPGAIEPARDLWTGVAARIDAKRKRVVLLRSAVATTSALLAAAAVLLVLRTAPAGPNGVTPAPVASAPAAATYVRPTFNMLGTPIVPEEETYQSAIVALAPSFDERMDALPPADAEAVAKSFEAIEAGIEATRAALEEDPSDQDLRAELDGEYEQELQTMNDVLDWTTRS
jgi:hypothetical protein